jgi:hypothetical protein
VEARSAASLTTQRGKWGRGGGRLGALRKRMRGGPAGGGRGRRTARAGEGWGADR